MNNFTDKELIEEIARRMRSNSELLQEQKDLMKELQSVNKKLQESESLKSHFISNITNEIVNPFSSILGLSKAILSVDKENWKKVFSMVALIYTEAFNLDFQLKNIFAAAKIEAGEIYPEIGTVDISNLVQSVTKTFRIEARKKKVSFEIISDEKSIPRDENGSFYFKTDAEKLKLILLNFLNNAVKYSLEEGLITLKYWLEDDQLFISVIDRGVGISDEHKNIIFDRFKRVDSGITSTNRGHGLGLSINKAVLDLLGGNVKIESQPGQGATFTINIPEATEDAFLMATDDNELFFNDKQVF
ncbi:MAG: sensor histidine kinase [Bacteroidota bacterium]